MVGFFVAPPRHLSVAPPVTITIGDVSGSPATPGANLTLVDRDLAVLNSVTVTKIGNYSTSAFTGKAKIVKRNSATNYDVVVNETITHPGGGWFDVTLASSYAVAASGDFYVAIYYANGSHDFTSGGNRSNTTVDVSGNGVTIAEDTGASFPSRYTYQP